MKFCLWEADVGTQDVWHARKIQPHISDQLNKITKLSQKSCILGMIEGHKENLSHGPAAGGAAAPSAPLVPAAMCVYTVYVYYVYKLGLGDISHVICMRISSVKPVPWLAANLHHLFSNGAAFNTLSRRSLTSDAISRSLSSAIMRVLQHLI